MNAESHVSTVGTGRDGGWGRGREEWERVDSLWVFVRLGGTDNWGSQGSGMLPRAQWNDGWNRQGGAQGGKASTLLGARRARRRTGQLARSSEPDVGTSAPTVRAEIGGGHRLGWALRDAEWPARGCGRGASDWAAWPAWLIPTLKAGWWWVAETGAFGWSHCSRVGAVDAWPEC